MTQTRRRFCTTAASLGLAALGVNACASGRDAVASRSGAAWVEALKIDDTVTAAAHLWSQPPNVHFRAQTPRERAVLLELVCGLVHEQSLATRPSAPLRTLAQQIELSIEVWDMERVTYWLLCEAPGRARGAGAYVFRVGASNTERYGVIQSPHSFHDVGTGILALELFVGTHGELCPQVLCVNTLHRYRPRPNVHRRYSPSDVCHTTDHPFNIVLAALATARPQIDVVQLHGFAEREVERLEGKGHEPLIAVVSHGAHTRSRPWSAQISSLLRMAWGGGVRYFPEEIQFLGGQTNVQGRLLAAHAESRFVHLELSTSLRERDHSSVVRTLAWALFKAAHPQRPA